MQNFNYIPLILALLLINISPPFSCELENQMIAAGLVDIHNVDTNIKVEMINAIVNNMLGINSYGCLTKCFLQPEVA
jgi:hypothetical protein